MSARHLRIIRFEPPPAPAADAGHAPSAEASTAGAPAPDRPADASDLRGAAFDEGCARGIVAADGRMIAANRALHALLHWHNAPPEGGSILWAVDAADRPALERVLREAGESGGGTVDARCPITGDAFAFFRFEAAPLPGAPGPARPLLVTVHEVTRVRSLEEQMAQRGRLELLGRLAAGVVHDFNNLLTVVMAHANAIRSEPGCPRPLAADAEGILEASARAVALGRQVLSFSRRQSVQPECLDLNTLFAETRRLVAHLLGPGVALEFRPTPGLWCVRFDKGQMIQVIMNLAANARDAMDGGGTLSLETFNLEDPGGPGPVRAVRDAARERHRVRHGRRDAGSGVRPVLHHQGTGARHGHRAGDRGRDRAPGRRRHPRAQPARTRHDLRGAAAEGRPGQGVAGRAGGARRGDG